MGLDSLSTVNFVSLIRERCSCDIPLSFLFQSPTVKDILVYLQTSSNADKMASGSHPALRDLQAQDQLLQLGNYKDHLTGKVPLCRRCPLVRVNDFDYRSQWRGAANRCNGLFGNPFVGRTTCYSRKLSNPLPCSMLRCYSTSCCVKYLYMYNFAPHMRHYYRMENNV